MRLAKECMICGKSYIGFEKYCSRHCLAETYGKK
ncbi:Hypothetical protein Nlim_1672 [Candidatus Nitrosarchaeum limnium SFB1]|uniref:DUF2116 family Zn-ribbon domain-containing protein n=1 Tax=Candidatus Nitrosarchaeum limnium SFB1 TaxID=886738 RepID=F3KMC3_9ARCH|nr:Hypothetical protein Nlim_1672 [Candidatus Nitrosarchaeum limnium SFB1]